MQRAHYATAPQPITGMPPGVPYIVGNEAAERFSYYGMRAILIVFMTQYLLGRDGEPDVMTPEVAKTWYHLFVSSVYFFPVLGAFVADGLLGKYRTIIYLSIVYCLGHAALSADDTRLGLAVGLSLIAIGSGGIKPCVSANVGDQFGQHNKHLLEKVYGWFYFSINAGSFISTLWIPWLLVHYGSKVAFAIPGILMLLATWIFWLGRNKFVHVPPAGSALLRNVFSPEGLGAIGKLASIYVFVAIFWSLYEQTGSEWVLQAEHMDRRIFGFEPSAPQTHAINPILILLFIPLFSYVIYPAIERVFRLTPLRKIGMGFVLTAAAFATTALIETWIADGQRPAWGWQFLAYCIMTAGEVMVSITGLEFSYTQAPTKMKSVIMSLFLLSNSAGQLFTALVNYFIQDENGESKITGPQYHWFFVALMLATAVVYVFVAMRYQERTYIQEEVTPAT